MDMVIIVWEWPQPKGTGQGEEQNMTEKRKLTGNDLGHQLIRRTT